MTTPESGAAAARSEPAEYVHLWAESFAQVLGQIHGSPLACVALEDIPEGVASAGADDLWILAACSGGLRGEMSLRLAPESIVRLAQIFLNGAVETNTSMTAEMTAEHRDAVLELLRQVAGRVTDSLKARWGEVQIRIETASDPSWPASSTVWLRAGESESFSHLEVQLSAALVAGLRTEPKSAPPSSDTLPAAPAAAVPLADSVPPGAPVPYDPGVNLDLLMDVELALTLRFGSRRLLLREVLDLGPGSVVELDRQVQEPVDVLLDGRVVAKGEVVVLGGNYAVRVIEVAPAEG